MALDLGKQVGPMPLGAWVAVVGTGLGIAYYTQRNGSATPTVTRDTSTATLDGEDAVGTGPGWVAVPPPSGAPGVVAYMDNDAWGSAAITTLIARGYDPGLAQSAIAHALQGATMSVREFALWTVALAILGPPPFSVDIVPPGVTGDPVVSPPDPPPAPPAPALGRWVWVTSADTLHTAARKAYGARDRWHDIYQANRDGVARPRGISPVPKPSAGWLSRDYATRPGLHFHTGGRWLFAPR